MAKVCAQPPAPDTAKQQSYVPIRSLFICLMLVPTIFSSSWKLFTYSVTQEASLLTSKNTVANHRIFQNWSPCPDLSTGTNNSASYELTLRWLRGQRSGGPFQRCWQQWLLFDLRASAVPQLTLL